MSVNEPSSDVTDKDMNEFVSLHNTFCCLSHFDVITN